MQKAPGIGCCPICCTFFSIFAALFLFVIAGLMNNDYHYIHMEGNMPQLSKSVTYAGLMYLLAAVISVAVWVKRAIKLGQFAKPSSFNQLQ